MSFEIGRESVLEALRQRAPKSMHLMEVVSALSIPKSNRDDVRDALLRLTEEGVAKEMPGNRFRLNKPKKAAQKAAPKTAQSEGRTPPRRGRDRAPEEGPGAFGWLSIHPRGFGFVAAEDGEDSIFVPGSGLNNAMHGDRVRVSVNHSAKGRDGEVLEVVERGVKRVSGVLFKRRKEAWLETSDPRLPKRVEVVGTIPLNVEPGEEVVALIASWPKYEGDAMEARVLSSLGVKGSAAVEIEKIKIREGIEEEFAEDVLHDAQSYGTTVSKREIARREDLRHLDLCTIDPPTARDHDDAVWAERLAGGGFRVIVAIADVSYYVRPNTALDRAALERATSIYLPDRVIPMLPHELSSNLASLVPDEDRLTMAVEVELGPKGAIRKHRFIEGVMRSRARLFYGGVAEALGLSEAAEAQPEAHARIPLLKTLWDVSQALRAKRRRRGSLDFDLPEAKIALGDDGEPVSIERSRNDPGMRKAYGMIEDLMLLANEVVAEDLSKRNMPAIYRIHGRPDEERIGVFAELAKSLGHELDEDAGHQPKKLAAFLKRIEGSEHTQALNFLLLRAMQQASYDTENVGHFALAAKDYLHFTSPIRRYPDLAVHRVVRSVIQKERVDKEELQTKLDQQSAQASRLERRAMLVDREATNLYRAILMKERCGEEFEATITGVAEHGLYVAFDAPFVEARCPIDTLGSDWYALDKLGLRLVGERSGHSFSLGGRIKVRLENVSIEARELTAHVVASLEEESRERPRGRGRGRSRGPSRDGGGESKRGGAAHEKRRARNKRGENEERPSRRRSKSDDGGSSSRGASKKRTSTRKKKGSTSSPNKSRRSNKDGGSSAGKPRKTRRTKR
ncbi:MAG: ribonuclease R [Sandaracinaceae bacterium]